MVLKKEDLRKIILITRIVLLHSYSHSSLNGTRVRVLCKCTVSLLRGIVTTTAAATTAMAAKMG